MKDNKLIAEFMELKHKNGDFFIPKTSRGYVGGDWLSQDELQFHSEWNWLMPVVSKIARDEEYFENAFSERLFDIVPFGRIEEVYEVVVEFIKEYNK